jgi:2-dehydropantoate 2-reductase
MHVAVLGAGALGRVFGVRLAGAGVAVDFVVRPSQLGEGAMRVEPIEGGAAHELLEPSRVTSIPAHADVVLVCVRVEQVDEAIAALARGPAVPVVMTTPILSRTWGRARDALGERLSTAVSSVTGYVNDAGVVRYWISKSARTTIDAPKRVDPALSHFVEALGRAGIEASLEPGVHESAPATAILFAPLVMAIDAAGSVDAFLADRGLRDLAFRANDEARVLAARVGAVAPWTSLLTKFIGPVVLRMSVGLVRRRSPEAIPFVERKLGRGNRPQNVATGREMIALAEEKGTPHAALGELVARLQ